MHLLCGTVLALLAFTAVSTSAIAQSIAQSSDRNRPKPVRPFLTATVGPSLVDGGYGDDVRPAWEIALGARKRITNRFGVALSALAGQESGQTFGGTASICYMREGVEGRCYRPVPLLNWYGASVGAEVYLGRAILGVGTGPASFGTEPNERIGTLMNEPTRTLGLRTHVEAIMPIYRGLGLSMAVAHRTVPELLTRRMKATSFGLGLTLR